MSNQRGQSETQGQDNSDQFINIFKSSEIELANEELRNWRDSYKHVK
jgi:hypothetical protein